MVLLTRQYRHQERKFIWETPRGFGENGQSSEQSAIRELKEEIGVEPVELIRLTNPDNNGDSIFFFARLFDEHITLSDPHEGLAGFKFMSISQFELMIINGTISDKNTIILYTLSKLKNLI
jgi:ADP-ribose pyrophosphatase